VGERFGTVPFEAAGHGVPCLWPQEGWLSEIVSDQAAEIVAWDARLAAERALDLLGDRGAAAANVAALGAVAATLTWSAAAIRLLELYNSACDEPANGARAIASVPPQTAPGTGLSEDTIRLLGPGGALDPELERPLLALATHVRIGRPVFAALKAGHRASVRLRRLAGEHGARGQ
jgi:hypothetical protein